MFDRLPVRKTYRILESGPIVLVSTRGNDGRANLMTMGFHMMMQHDPPTVGVIVGPWDHSYQALTETEECVLTVPTIDMAALFRFRSSVEGEDHSCRPSDENRIDKKLECVRLESLDETFRNHRTDEQCDADGKSTCDDGLRKYA